MTTASDQQAAAALAATRTTADESREVPSRAELREARPIRNRDRGERRRREDLLRREAEILEALKRRETPSDRQARAALGREVD